MVASTSNRAEAEGEGRYPGMALPDDPNTSAISVIPAPSGAEGEARGTGRDPGQAWIGSRARFGLRFAAAATG